MHKKVNVMCITSFLSPDAGQTIYKYIYLFVIHGSIRDTLQNGWEHIENVMALRKKVRKLRMRTCQEEQDLIVSSNSILNDIT